MEANQIQEVKDSEEKVALYNKNSKRYKKAKKSGFYFECLWILYAMIEDMTSTFFFNIGFTSENDKSKVTNTKIIKDDIRDIFKMKTKQDKYRLDNINGKFTRIKDILAWSKLEHKKLSDYQKCLIKALHEIMNSSKFEEAVNYLNDEWRNKRNQLTHSLFSKNYNAVLDELPQLVEKGYDEIGKLNNYFKRIEGFDIRAQFKIK